MPWEDVAENSNSENSIPTFWDGVDIKPKKKVMALIDCPHCQKRLRVPVDYSGRLSCPGCSKVFDRQNGETQCTIYDDEEWLVGNEILFAFAFSPLLKIVTSIIGFFIYLIYVMN